MHTRQCGASTIELSAKYIMMQNVVWRLTVCWIIGPMAAAMSCVAPVATTSPGPGRSWATGANPSGTFRMSGGTSTAVGGTATCQSTKSQHRSSTCQLLPTNLSPMNLWSNPEWTLGGGCPAGGLAACVVWLTSGVRESRSPIVLDPVKWKTKFNNWSNKLPEPSCNKK